MPAPLIPLLTTLAPIMVEVLAQKTALPSEIEQKLKKAASRLGQDDLSEMQDVLRQSDAQQMSLNSLDAVSTRFWQAGWRPFIGWTCGMAFCWHFLLSPITVMIAASAGVTLAPISFEMETLNTTLFGLLGLGAMRSFEKVKLR